MPGTSRGGSGRDRGEGAGGPWKAEVPLKAPINAGEARSGAAKPSNPHHGGRGGRGVAAKGAGRARGGRGRAGEQPSSNAAPEATQAAKAKGGGARDEIHQEITSLLQHKTPLQRNDFDGQVRQCLHAIHGIGGHQGVHDALQIIQLQTTKKERASVGKWSAYIHKLLRRFLDNSTAEVRARCIAEHSIPETVADKVLPPSQLDSQGSPESTAAGSGRLSSGGASGANVDASGRFSTGSSGSGVPELTAVRQTVKSIDVPLRVHSGQLVEPELHSEFICPICLDLCEDATVLPCSHVFCRACLRTLLDWKKGHDDPSSSSSSSTPAAAPSGAAAPGASSGNLAWTPPNDVAARRDTLAAMRAAAARPADLACPACRAPFGVNSVHESSGESTWLTRWINNIQVCCVFSRRRDLPDPDDDPLPNDHLSREMGLHCGWRGSVSGYREHIRRTCPVAAHLRRLGAEEGILETPDRQVEQARLDQGTSGLSTASVTFPQAGIVPSTPERPAGAAAAAFTPPIPSADEKASWNTGDFVVMAKWQNDREEGGTTTVKVEAGDFVYVHEVEERGWWAYATLLANGQEGWLPHDFCERRILDAVVPFEGRGGLRPDGGGYVKVAVGDRIKVYRRENGWCYGERLPSASGAIAARGWFPTRTVDGT